MTVVTQILSRAERGDPSAAEQLLPLVYDELRKLAAVKLAQEKPSQTLQATANVPFRFVTPGDGADAHKQDALRGAGDGRCALRADFPMPGVMRSPSAGGLRFRATLEDVHRIAARFAQQLGRVDPMSATRSLDLCP